MRYFTLYPADPTLRAWCFYDDDTRGRLALRPEYQDLACPVCGKFDENRALSRGISPEFKPKTRRDWVGSADDRILASARFRDVVTGVDGLEFLPLPARSDYFLVSCVHVVETDERLAGFENRQPCPACGRFRERLVGPRLASMRLPAEGRSVFVSEIANENAKVSYRPMFADEVLVGMLRDAKVSGIDYVAAW